MIKAPILILAGTEDPFSYPRMKPLSEAVPGSRTAEIKEGMVPMVGQMPKELARIVLEFLG